MSFSHPTSGTFAPKTKYCHKVTTKEIKVPCYTTANKKWHPRFCKEDGQMRQADRQITSEGQKERKVYWSTHLTCCSVYRLYRRVLHVLKFLHFESKKK